MYNNQCPGVRSSPFYPLLTKQDLFNLSIFFNIVEFPEALAGSYRTMKQNAGNLSGNGKRGALLRSISGAKSDIPTSKRGGSLA